MSTRCFSRELNKEHSASWKQAVGEWAEAAADGSSNDVRRVSESTWTMRHACFTELAMAPRRRLVVSTG